MAHILEDEVWVILPAKELQPVEVFAEGKWNMEQIVEEGNYESNDEHVTTYRNKGYNCHEYFLLILL